MTSQLDAVAADRERERAWRAMMAGCPSEQLNQIHRRAGAAHGRCPNAGLPDYRAYAFRDRGRFDYPPEDCFTFHEAIAEAVVPAAGACPAALPAPEPDSLRPWDLRVEPGAVEPRSLTGRRLAGSRASSRYSTRSILLGSAFRRWSTKAADLRRVRANSSAATAYASAAWPHLHERHGHA